MREFAPSRRVLPSLILLALVALSVGCSTKASSEKAPPTTTEPSTATETTKGATIDITPGGPADTVRAFYRHLRDRNIRGAMFLTNMRPAIEGLTDAELKDFSLDFERIAGQVPAEIKINGEIVSGDKASVTVELPPAAGEEAETQRIQLRRENGIWVLLSVGEDGERKMKAEGKQYFYNLRIETHHEEAQAMLKRIGKGQLVYAAQNGGVNGDLQALVAQGLVPDDALSGASTGYNYSIDLGPEGRSYTASAVPVEYGKSGKLSFLLDSGSIASRDNGGKALAK